MHAWRFLINTPCQAPAERPERRTAPPVRLGPPRRQPGGRVGVSQRVGRPPRPQRRAAAVAEEGAAQGGVGGRRRGAQQGEGFGVPACLFGCRRALNARSKQALLRGD
jgi:hypothetical protein